MERFLSYYRLRSKLEKINIHIEIVSREAFKDVPKVEQLDAFTQHYIKDEQAKTAWMKSFGKEVN